MVLAAALALFFLRSLAQKSASGTKTCHFGAQWGVGLEQALDIGLELLDLGIGNAIVIAANMASSIDQNKVLAVRNDVTGQTHFEIFTDDFFQLGFNAGEEVPMRTRPLFLGILGQDIR